MQPSNKKVSENGLAGLLSRNRKMTLFTRSAKVWFITGGFVVAMLGSVAVAFVVLQNSNHSDTAAQYNQQNLGNDAVDVLKKNAPAPKDYLLNANQPAILVATTPTSDTINNVYNITNVANSSTTNTYLTNDSTTTQIITNNAYNTTEVVTNNSTYMTEIINKIILTAGEGIAISEADDGYIISVAGTANEALSNLRQVAINTDLLPKTGTSIDIGSSTRLFEKGYFNGDVVAATLNSPDGATLTIGGASSDVSIGAATSIAGSMSISSTGALIKNPQDSASALQVQKSTGQVIFNVDTSATQVAIGSNAISNNTLKVGRLTTGDTSARMTIATAGASSKGLIIQALNTSQAANLFEVQTSSGAQLVYIDKTGKVSAAGGLTTTGALSTMTDASVGGSLAVTGGMTMGGAATIKTTTNSASALSVQNTVGQNVLNVNTVDSRVDVGVFQPTKLWIKPAVTATKYTPAGSSPNLAKTYTADFNGDGFMDFMVNATSTTGTVYNSALYINQGDGTFKPPVYGQTNILCAGDVNRDGKADIVIAYSIASNTNGVTVLMGRGDGTFDASGSSYPLNDPYGSVSARLADINGDSALDLVVYGSTITTRLNTGTGMFGNIVTSIPIGTLVTDTLIFIDFDRDGKLDIAYPDRIAYAAVILKGAGNGTFPSRSTYSSGVNWPVWLVAGDYDGDGSQDIAIGTYYDPNIRFRFNNGDGTMGTEKSFVAGTRPYGMVSGNLGAGDGVAVADVTTRTMNVLLANGQGGMSLQSSFAVNFTSNSSSPQNLAMGDFNNDGLTDFVLNDTHETDVMLMTAYGTYNTSAPSAKLLINVNADEAGQVIKGKEGQSADYIRVIDSYENQVMNLDKSGTMSLSGGLTVASAAALHGALTVQTTTNTAGAFSVQNASNASIFAVDTQNGRIGIKNGVPTNTLSVNTLTVSDVAAQVAISTNISTAKGLVVQGVSGQSADLIQAQNSFGTVLLSLSQNGTLSVSAATIAGNLSINSGHIITFGTAPSFTAGAAACTSPTISVAGNDISGTVSITTGTGCVSGGVLSTISFRNAYGGAPRVMLSASNAAASSLGLYSGASSTANFTIDSANTPTASTVYKVNYWIVQ